MKITYKFAEDINLENIEVYRKYADGEHIGYRLTAKRGYKLLDTVNGVKTEADEITGEAILRKYYCENAYPPANCPPEKWTYIAVPETPETLENTY